MPLEVARELEALEHLVIRLEDLLGVDSFTHPAPPGGHRWLWEFAQSTLSAHYESSGLPRLPVSAEGSQGTFFTHFHLAAAHRSLWLVRRAFRGPSPPPGSVPASLVLSHYYVHRPDPQRNCMTRGNLHHYIANWTLSLAAQGLPGLLLHDGLSTGFQEDFAGLGLEFGAVDVRNRSSYTEDDAELVAWFNETAVRRKRLERMAAMRGLLSPNDFRVLVSLEELVRRRAEFADGYVLITDVNDVVFERNPFAFMHLMHGSYDLFVGDESFSSAANLLDWIGRCYVWYDAQQVDPLAMPVRSSGVFFNIGVIGGRFEAVVWLLERVVDELWRIFDGNNGRLPHRICDMAAFNRVLWRYTTPSALSQASAVAQVSDGSLDDLFPEPGPTISEPVRSRGNHGGARNPRPPFRVFWGFPFTSPFRAFVPGNNSWYYVVHK